MSPDSPPPTQAGPADIDAPEAGTPSGRSADSLPRGAGVAGATAADGRSQDPLDGDPEIEEGEDGEGI